MKDKSTAMQLMELVWKNCCEVTGHSWERINRSMQGSLRLAIDAGLRFDRDDFTAIENRMRIGFWGGNDGHMLGEHGWMGKGVMPLYSEVSRTPLFIWDPRTGRKNERNGCLVQAIDWAPTLLEYFGQEVPPDMLGKPLKNVIADGRAVREAGLFGGHGGHVNCTDGRYVYMRPCGDQGNQPIYNYTLMPTHMRGFFSDNELADIQLAEPFSFTKGYRTLKTPSRAWGNSRQFGTLLFDLENDPGQEHPLEDKTIENRMIDLLVTTMRENDAPKEQYQRLGLKD